MRFQPIGGVKPPIDGISWECVARPRQDHLQWRTFDDIGLVAGPAKGLAIGSAVAPRSSLLGEERAPTEATFKVSALAKPFTKYTMAALDAQPPLKWLVRGMLHEGSIGMLVGASMSFKTFVALDMALRMAYGLEYHGRKAKAGTVAYVAGEGRIKLRVRAWCKHHGISHLSSNFIAYETHSTLYDRATIDRLADDLAADSPQLVWLDTLNACFSGMEENSAKDGGLTIELMRHLSYRLGGASVIVLHHPSRANPQQERGTTALLAGSDVVFLCYRPAPNEYRTELRHLKQKDDAPMLPLRFSLESVSLGVDEDDVAVTSLVPVENHDPIDAEDSSSKWREAVLGALRNEHLATGKLWVVVSGKNGRPTGHFSKFLKGLRDAGWITKPDGERGGWQLTEWGNEHLGGATLPVLPDTPNGFGSTPLNLVQPAA